jgi:hypothetical protein
VSKLVEVTVVRVRSTFSLVKVTDDVIVEVTGEAVAEIDELVKGNEVTEVSCSGPKPLNSSMRPEKKAISGKYKLIYFFILITFYGLRRGL